MKIGIHSNVIKDIDYELAYKISKYLQDKNFEVIKLFEIEHNYDSDLKNIDVVIVIGGDGTILNFLQNCKDKSIKILGINSGRLGYLTDSDKSDAFTSIDNMLKGNYYIENRIMINCEHNGVVKTALNDLYINKYSTTKLVEVNVEVNGSELESFRGDGVVVSTPTGSTAYNLSAGGAILKPDGDMLAITPICPHMLYTRPVIVDGDDEIKLSVNLKDGDKAVAFIDGDIFIKLKNCDTIKITKSEQMVRLIKTTNKNFYNVLKDKMLR